MSAQGSTATLRAAGLWGTHSPLSFDLTVTGDVQFHQLHEVGNLRGKSLDFIVTQTQLAQVQKPKEWL